MVEGVPLHSRDSCQQRCGMTDDCSAAARLCVFACRGTEVVEGVLRHHISACFAALQRKLLDLLHDALPGLRASARSVVPAAPKPFPGAPQSSPAIEVSPISNSCSPSFCVLYLQVLL